MSMMSRAWLRRLRRTDSWGKGRGFCKWIGYEGSERGGGRVCRRRLMSYAAWHISWADHVQRDSRDKADSNEAITASVGGEPEYWFLTFNFLR